MLTTLVLGALLSQPMGRAVVLSGEVTVEPPGAAAKPVAVGDILNVGDVVRTGTEGRARLYLDNRSIVDLSPETRLELKSLAPSDGAQTVSLRLWLGRLWARVAGASRDTPRFNVETANAVAGVRGTSFFLDSQNDDAELTVEAGTVEVKSTAESPVQLEARDRLRFGKGGRRLDRGLGLDVLRSLRQRHEVQGELRRGDPEQRLAQLRKGHKSLRGARWGHLRERLREKLRSRFHLDLDPEADGDWRARLRALR